MCANKLYRSVHHKYNMCANRELWLYYNGVVVKDEENANY